MFAAMFNPTDVFSTKAISLGFAPISFAKKGFPPSFQSIEVSPKFESSSMHLWTASATGLGSGDGVIQKYLVLGYWELFANFIHVFHEACSC